MSPSPLPITATTPDAFGISVDRNNHLTTSGFSYDASGNVLNDGINAYAWNAESETKTAAGVNYIYDRLGNHVEKANGTLYWYGPGGEVLDETDLTGNLTSEYVFFGGKRVARRDASGNIYYYAEDFIGSSRVITQSNGTLCSDADFLPFGQEVDYTSGCAQNYKFEGKERDIETGNDNFGARYYRSALGRWQSPDWSAIPVAVPYANLTNPQTLNLYAMTSDNPETFADLDGHFGGVIEPLVDFGGFNPDVLPGQGFDETVGQGFASLASAPPDPVPQQPPAPPQSPTDVQAQNEGAAAPALKGLYVADLKSKEIAPLLDPNHKPSKSDVVGPNGECVDLTKKFSGMGKEDIGTYRWRPGPKVVGNKDIKPGTAIATFNGKGRYPSAHRWNSGIYLNSGVNGSIWILDQWPGHPPMPREILLDNSRAPADNSAAYSVILVAPR